MINLQEMLTPGLEAIVQKTVHDSDTAANSGSGALACLLATPAYVDLMISAATDAVEKKLPEGFITVGRSMEFTHEAPTGTGMTVSVKATLASIDGNRLLFNIVAYDELGEIGRGKHERVVVNRDQLLQKAKIRMKDIDRKYLK
jgi:fluoroacetyl-CoA thioesterase